MLSEENLEAILDAQFDNILSLPMRHSAAVTKLLKETEGRWDEDPKGAEQFYLDETDEPARYAERTVMKKQRTTHVSMDGCVCVVTGANSGVGFETSLQLARHDAHLVMVFRNQARGAAAKAKIQAVARGQVDLILADLSSLAEVRNLAKTLLDRYPKIHVLVNNAGLYNSRNVGCSPSIEPLSRHWA